MDLRAIPKVELHRHLDLTFRLSTLKELAPSLGIELPTDEKTLRAKLLVTEPMKDLSSVLQKFFLAQSFLATEEILERIAFEAVEDAYAEGIRILELRYAPTFVQKDHPHLTFEKIHQAFVRGVAKGEKKYPIAVGLILIAQRILPVAVAEQVIDFAIANKDTVIGVDLADDEMGFDCKPFAPAFQRAKKAGLRVTIHAGEADFAGAPQSVLDSIEFLGAERIGHGLQIINNEKALKFVIDKKIPLELCPYSNWLTNAVRDHARHPFVRLMEAGVLTTINSDDPGIMDSTLLTDYDLLAKYHQMTTKQFEACNDIAARASFIPLAKKQKVWLRPL